jgi:IS1 family transposase
VHQALVETGQLDLVHVQVDEIRVKGCKIIPWMGLAMMISTRLWLAGTASQTRERKLADGLMHQVRRCSQAMRALLICTDGWAAYPNSIRRVFREKVKKTLGRGRACLQIWPDLHIGTVIKRTEKKRIIEVTRKMSYGSDGQAEILLKQSAGGNVLNTAFIERFNGTMRERLATLTRKCRHSARRLLPLEKGMYQSPS